MKNQFRYYQDWFYSAVSAAIGKFSKALYIQGAVLASAATEFGAVNRYQNSIQIFFIPKMNMVHKNSWVPVCLDDSNTPIVTRSTEFPMLRIIQLPFSFINNSFFKIFSSICYLEGL